LNSCEYNPNILNKQGLSINKEKNIDKKKKGEPIMYKQKNFFDNLINDSDDNRNFKSNRVDDNYEIFPNKIKTFKNHNFKNNEDLEIPTEKNNYIKIKNSEYHSNNIG